MASLSFIVGIVGNIISILVFASPIGTFWRVVKNKSTENFKGIPYVTTLLSTSLWTYYGLLKPGGLLILTVNGVGSALQATYVTLFLIFAPKDTRVKIGKLVAIFNVASVGAVIAITLFAIHGDMRLTVIGCICAGLTVGMYASPMAAMRIVIKTKSVEFMPFSLSFFLFLNGGVWATYAALVRDFYVGVPNVIGFVLGSAQLIVYTIYRDKKTDIEKEEEGSAHLIEMKGYEDQEKAPNRSLNKGRSLPKTTVSRQHSLQKIVKAHSLTPYECHSNWTDEDEDVSHAA
ncbi:bidirectional sugar transporter SWEET16-like [Tasmannia lanceolata]|uniref:bidirectional sugar transporter SWEET16-like n=1 Tax=Tasmannia lanceolata TaxID=3420 RepID=UPI0040630847